MCEVALGAPNKLLHADCNAASLPAGTMSTWGMGSTTPDPTANTTLTCGSVVPCGKMTASGVRGGSLLYDEFIVYDTAQIKMRYLVRVTFKF